MPSGFLPNLNTAFGFGFRRAVGLQQGRLLCRNPTFGNSRSDPFVVGALSGSTTQAFEYPSNRKPMAASGSKSASGDLIVDNLISSSCGNVSNFAKPSGVYFGDRSRPSFPKASMSMRNREPTRGDMVYGYFIYDMAQKSCNSNPLVALRSKNCHTSSSPCYSDGTAPDVLLNGLSSDEQLEGSSISVDKKNVGDRTLKLFSGVCYLPHPDKEETGGEDAHFICAEEQVIGVADGVGGWADVGVNAGLYSRELMSYSVDAIQDEPKGCIDPARVLGRAHSKTKAEGSSTACIIALTDQQGIHAINLGDSGFVVIRDGCTVFQSPVQQHGFNFTYQLESGTRGDLPSSGQVFTIPVAPGDVIVAGTDGLFDNLYNNEVTAVVVHGVRAGLSPKATAQKIAALARQRALDRNHQSPFSTAAQEAGFRYYGGKLDDITVVVSYISSSTSN